MQTIKAAWPILGQMLGNILRKWLIDTVRNERRNHNPKLFQAKGFASLTTEEVKSKTNRVMCWAIASARENVRDETSNKYRLLSMMFCKEKYVDDEYIRTCYDLTMLLRNIGGNGGLCLVSEAFFDWGFKAMRIISKELTVSDIRMKGTKAFGKAK